MNQPETYQHRVDPLRTEARIPAGGAEVVRLDGYERGERPASASSQRAESVPGSPDNPAITLRIPGGLERFVAKLDREGPARIDPDTLAEMDKDIDGLIEPAPSHAQETDHGMHSTHQADAAQGLGDRDAEIHGEEMTGTAHNRPEEKVMADEVPAQATTVEQSAQDTAESPELPEQGRARALEHPGSMRMQLEGERQDELERMEQVMAHVNRSLPVANATLLDTSEQLDFIRKVGLAIAELDWFARGDSPERLRLANALMNYRYQLQGLTRDLNRSNKVIAKIRRETAALEKNLESARRVARQLGTSRRHLRSNRDYEGELRKVILLQDRLIQLNSRETKEQYIRREVMKKADDMNQELREFAARLESHAGNRLGAVPAIGRTG